MPSIMRSYTRCVACIVVRMHRHDSGRALSSTTPASKGAHRGLPRLRHEACGIVVQLQRHQVPVQCPVIDVVFLYRARSGHGCCASLQSSLRCIRALGIPGRTAHLHLLDDFTVVCVCQLVQEAVLEDVGEDWGVRETGGR